MICKKKSLALSISFQHLIYFIFPKTCSKQVLIYENLLIITDTVVTFEELRLSWKTHIVYQREIAAIYKKNSVIRKKKIQT